MTETPAIGELGPCMAVLTEKQRKYVLALFESPKARGSGLFAAKAAGYGTATSSDRSLSSMAFQLNCDPKIQAAVSEVSKQYLSVLGPHAVRALKRVLDDPKHRDFGRALGIIMDRVSPVQSTALLKVEHDVAPSMRAVADAAARIMELAASAGIPPMIDVTPRKEVA